ncbi:MAG: MarR family winged helix-turn-helix transcriptional regulator [Pseudomonadota bacterium]
MTAASDHRVFHLLQLAAHRVKTHADRNSLAKAGVTAAQAAVLHVLSRTPGATQKVVADQLKQQESAITAMAARLAEAGLLVRTPSAVDRRAWALNLTPAGEAALSGFRAPLDELNATLTEVLGGEAQVEAFAVSLKAILDADL